MRSFLKNLFLVIYRSLTACKSETTSEKHRRNTVVYIRYLCGHVTNFQTQTRTFSKKPKSKFFGEQKAIIYVS